mgnify:CR=1 FL=1
MKINFVEKKNFYIFDLKGFISDDLYNSLRKNFPDLESEYYKFANKKKNYF